MVPFEPGAEHPRGAVLGVQSKEAKAFGPPQVPAPSLKPLTLRLKGFSRDEPSLDFTMPCSTAVTTKFQRAPRTLCGA